MEDTHHEALSPSCLNNNVIVWNQVDVHRVAWTGLDWVCGPQEEKHLGSQVDEGETFVQQ